MLTFIVTSIDVNVPVRTAYTQWTQFEDFPHFMEGVKAVQKLGARRFHWKEEWDAEITEQTPDQRIAWRSCGGAINGASCPSIASRMPDPRSCWSWLMTRRAWWSISEMRSAWCLRMYDEI